MSCVTSENEEGLMIVKIEYLYFSVHQRLMVFFSFLFALLTLCCFYHPSSLTFYYHFVVLITYYKVSIPVPAGELKVMRVDGTFQKDTQTSQLLWRPPHIFLCASTGSIIFSVCTNPSPPVVFFFFFSSSPCGY